MYLDYYKLVAKPFQINPDLRFFFESEGHRRALSYLRYGLIEGQGFIVVTGSVGTGKTTLARSLFRELNSDEIVAAQLVSTQLEAEDLLRATVSAFGMNHEGLSKASLLINFEEFLRDLVSRGKRALLLVDEVQNLSGKSLEELRMLSNIQFADSPPLQSFLLGQEEFRVTLTGPEMEQLRQRVIATCHLNAFGPLETRAYIEHRLGVAGWKGAPQILDGAFLAIHEAAEGVPRKINTLCDRLLLFGCLEELGTISSEIVCKVVREMSADIRQMPGSVEWHQSPSPEPVAPAVRTLEQRVTELEQILSDLGAADKGEAPQTESEKTAEQVLDIKSELATLQRGIWELTKLVSNRVANK